VNESTLWSKNGFVRDSGFFLRRTAVFHGRPLMDNPGLGRGHLGQRSYRRQIAPELVIAILRPNLTLNCVGGKDESEDNHGARAKYRSAWFLSSFDGCLAGSVLSEEI